MNDPPLSGGPRIATLATCNLDQWAMDFAGNVARVKASVEQARAMGATYRVSRRT
jgi:NAD+ synthase (glutamine-hydrolysing)